MTHFLYIIAIALFGLYCEGRGFRRGVKCEAGRQHEHQWAGTWPADSTQVFHRCRVPGCGVYKQVSGIPCKPESPSTIKTRHIDGTITEHNIDSFGNEKPSPSTL